MRVGVLGGTFNPVHYGHLRAAEEVREGLGLEKVLFIPAGTPPLKSSDLADADRRYTMARMAVAGNPWFEVSDMELRRGGKSYTIDTVERLKAMYPGAEIYFILGIDAFLDLPDWKEPDRLVRSVNFVVINRPPHRFTSLTASPFLDAEEDVLRALEEGRAGQETFALEGGRTLTLMAVTSLAISATELRALRKHGKSIKYLLPENIESFIMSDGLYAK